MKNTDILKFEKEYIYERISFKDIQTDFAYAIKTVTGFANIDPTIPYSWWNDARYARTNKEILNKLDDILFCNIDSGKPILYKKLNYLITLMTAKKFCYDELEQYLNGKGAFSDIEKNLPIDLLSNVIEIHNQSLCIDEDNIWITEMPEDFDSSILEDELTDEEEDALAIGMDYLAELYNPDKIHYDNAIDLSIAINTFKDVIDLITDYGRTHVALTNDDETYECYLHSDEDNIHIIFLVDPIRKRTTPLNPITKEPMDIDIYKPWWEIKK